MSPMQVNHTMTQLRTELEMARAEIERLRALLRDALPFVNDAGIDEDPEANRRATETADAIRRALEGK